MAPAPVVEVGGEEPRCTVCGFPVRKVAGLLVHYDGGRLELMMRAPRVHDATLEPQDWA